jgi:hypothetical protein
MSSFDSKSGIEGDEESFPKLTKKFSFRGADVQEENFLPLRKGHSFADVKSPSQFSKFRAESCGSSESLSAVAADSAENLPFKFSKCSAEEEAVIVVDTFSTGAYLTHVLFHAGYSVICVLSGDLRHLLDMVSKNLSYSFAATHVFKEDEESPLEALVERIRASIDLPITAVFAGAETGVILADMLSERLALRTNGTKLSEARRDKYVMGETIRRAGIRAVKQLVTAEIEEVRSYILEWNPQPFEVIVKPCNSAGSDSVTLCRSMEDVEKAFLAIIGRPNGLGLFNSTVLIQEYLTGTEYVVDTVSMDGEHKGIYFHVCFYFLSRATLFIAVILLKLRKVIAVWEYDRRAINGAGFVCMAQRLMCSDEAIVEPLIAYQLRVLDALEVANGPTHGEVKWHHGEPVQYLYNAHYVFCKTKE